MRYTTWDDCPECKKEISVPWDTEKHGHSGIRVLKCPYCGYEFNMGFWTEKGKGATEYQINEIIKQKKYLLEVA